MERLESHAGIPELAHYEDGFDAWLGRLGYSPRTREAQGALLRHLAGWLARRSVPLAGRGHHQGIRLKPAYHPDEKRPADAGDHVRRSRDPGGYGSR